jgi:hypothetical protein
MFIAIGYTLFDLAELVARVWNTNTNYIAPEDDSHDDISLNKKTLQADTVMVSEDIASDEFGYDQFRVQDTHKNEIKRRWILGSLMGIFTVLSLGDGLLLVYNNPQTMTSFILMIVFYFMTCSALSTSLYSAMIHAKLHVIEEVCPRLQIWIAITALWCAILFCSTIPLLVGVTLETARSIIENQALLCFLGIAIGAMLKIQVYFHNMKVSSIDRQDLLWGGAIFSFSIAQAIVSGFFL